MTIEQAAFVFEKTGENSYRCIKARYGDVTVGETYPESTVAAIANKYETVITEVSARPKLAEIIPFPCAANELAAIFEALAEQARAGHISGFIYAAVGADGDVRNAVTGWYGLDVGDRAALTQQLQYDVIDAFIEEKLTEVFE